MTEIEEFNKRVVDAHNSHYKNGQNELIDTNPNASPNANQIYHFYSNGEITCQKGAWAYLQRSEFNREYAILGARNYPFKFIEEGEHGKTYAILTEEECYEFRKKMEDIMSRLKK